MYGMDLSILLGGAIVTETIFNIPGIGQYVVQAIPQNNIPVILGTSLIAAFFIILFNILVDIAYGVLDPRISYS
jgi:peptide/nickel transport system permease protein